LKPAVKTRPHHGVAGPANSTNSTIKLVSTNLAHY
jgi:hypothetical protein